jgi:hypothetical protein
LLICINRCTICAHPPTCALLGPNENHTPQAEFGKREWVVKREGAVTRRLSR